MEHQEPALREGYDETGALWIDGVCAFFKGIVTDDYLTYLRLQITNYESRVKALEEEISTLKWALDNPNKTSVPEPEIAYSLAMRHERIRLARSLRRRFIDRLEFCVLECRDKVISA